MKCISFATSRAYKCGFPRLHFHRVAVNDYGLFKYPDYTLPLSVHMKHVQPVIAANFGHAHRERQGVVGIFEQSVIVNHDAMEMKSRPIHRQTKRPLVANEMHFVSPARQILAQRRRQNAASANGRIAGDADAKRVFGAM